MNISGNNITVKTVMQYTDFSFMTVYDQTDLFSILISHGIYYAKMVEPNKRDIIIKSMNKGNQILVQLIYPCKKELKHHAIETDLSSLIHKYNANITNKKLNDKDIMNLIILFNIKNN